MRTQLTLVFAIALLVGACNRVTDLQPEETVPQSAINAVRAKFPNATDMVFKSLEKNRVWQVDFGQQANRYRGAVNDTTMLVAFLRAATAPDSVRALIEATSVRGGQFMGDFKQQVAFNKGDFRYNVFLTDYSWQGKTYSIGYTDFRIVGSNLFVYRTLSLNDPISFLYTTGDQNILPGKILAFLNDKGLSAAGAPYQEEPISVQIMEDGKKKYVLSARKVKGGSSFSFTIVFDDAGDYLYAGSIPTSDGGSAGVDGSTRVVSSKIDGVPEAIRTTFLMNPEYKGFAFDRLEVISVYNQMTNRVVLANSMKETWVLYYNDRGSLVSRSLQLPIK